MNRRGVIRRMCFDMTGAVLVEFAILLSLYLFILFGTFEIGLALLYTSMLNAGVEKGREYVVSRRGNYFSVTEAGLRSAICARLTSMPISCSDAKLKIALIDAEDPGATNLRLSYPIENRFDGPMKGQYVLAVGYAWPFSLPTTSWALPFSGPKAQVQSVQFIVAAERVTE